MSEAQGQQKNDLPSTDWQRLDRLVGRLQWHEKNRPDIQILPTQREWIPSSLTSREAYQEAKKQADRYYERQMMENGRRLGKIAVYDLEAQKVLLSQEHKMYRVMERVIKRLGQAEKRLRERGGLNREEGAEQYQVYVTLRDKINAWTFRHGRMVVIEAGLISMLDKYLREVKHLSGISEDHIAGLLAHELSHTDKEAQQRYMNEEYCDTQGVILSAEAGYNPRAMIDIEDFLIYLEKGEKLRGDVEKDEKKPAFFPTHPPSENRRLVIINLLSSKESLIPNQTRDYTPIAFDLINDIDKQMREWVEDRQRRVMLTTRDDCIEAVNSAQNITELTEAMMGYEIFRRAELTKAIAENEDFDRVSVLVDAICTEVRHQSDKRNESLRFIKGYPSRKDVRNYIGEEENSYRGEHIIVGGVARRIESVDEPNIYEKAKEAVYAMVDGCENLEPELETERKYAPFYDKKGNLLTEEERKKQQVQLDAKWEKESQEKTKALKDLLHYILENRQEINIPALLAGDFSSAPALQKKLEQFGVRDFHHYLKKLQDAFGRFYINPALKSLVSDRMKKIFPDDSLLSVSVSKMTSQQIASLLEATRYYRAGLVVEAHFGNVNIFNKFDSVFGNDAFTQAYHKSLKEKISQIGRSYSQTPEEQALLEELFLINYGEIRGGYPFGKEHKVIDQLITSKKTTSETLMDKFPKEISPFQSTLTSDFFNFRIAPSFGGELFGVYLNKNSRLIPYDLILGKAISLGRNIDKVRVYHGKIDYEQRKDKYGNTYYTLVPKKRDADGYVDLIKHRRSTIPVIGNDIISPSSLFEALEITEDQSHPNFYWEKMKIIAEASNFERQHLQSLILTSGISTQEKIAYFQQLIKEGKITYEQIFQGSIIRNSRDILDNNYLYKKRNFTYEEAVQLRMSYDFAMALLRTIPLSPSYQDIDISALCQRLYETKVKIALLEEAGVYNNEQREGVQLNSEDLFEGLPMPERALKQLDFIFEFVKEGGTIALSEKTKERHSDFLYIAGMSNQGADVNILRILKDLNYPTTIVEKKVREILDLNKDRYTPFEVDKWESLIAFVKQPYLYYDSQEEYYFVPELSLPWRLRLVDSEGDYREQLYHPFNLDDSLKLIEAIMKLPACSYRDYCISLIIERSSHYKFQKELSNHPGKEYYEGVINQIAVKAFSDFGLRRVYDQQIGDEQSLSQLLSLDFIPQSEDFINDPFVGFYLGESLAVKSWSRLIKSERDYSILSPFSKNYRDRLSQQGITGLEAELKILSDRISLIEDMPDSLLKEALMLYAIKTAQNKVKLFSGEQRDQLKAAVADLVQKSANSFISEQGKSGIFDIMLRNEIGILEGPISYEALRKHFPTREEYIEYIVKFLPSKSAVRDGYLILGVEAYPMKVRDASSIRSLMFVNDYGTLDKQVLTQRAALEFIRTIKSNKHITSQYIREFLLWIIDDKRQAKMIDDFFINLSNNKAGRKLIRGLMEQLKIGPYKKIKEEDENRQQTGLSAKITDIETRILTETILRLPPRIKRIIVQKILFKNSSVALYTEEQRNAVLMRAGMPTGFTKLITNNYLNSSLTFNSILEEGSVDRPLRRELFFDLALGDNGILEEPVETNDLDFTDRAKRNFDGSQMHAFIDDILGIAFRNGDWDKKSKEVAYVVAHSLIEALEPPRRATVLFNLLSELPKIDFNDPDKNRVRSRFLQAALSSIGILGAKLGQIDELIPKGWGSEMASLKHATKPMSKLMVADIFLQEGLSEDYVIKDSAGAASTACGYIIETPSGEEQFAKVLRPEVKLDWRRDFDAVGHMLKCLKNSGYLQTETESIRQQIEKLVEEELQTQREIENVIYYRQAEPEESRMRRGGIRTVEMPKERHLSSREGVSPPKEHLVILSELLPKDRYIELSKLRLDVDSRNLPPEITSIRESIDVQSVCQTIVQDFLYRAFEVGSWHTDLHDGNILVAYDGSNRVARQITGDDLVLIDFGQTGKAETEEKKRNAARFFTGLALRDRRLVAQAINEALIEPIPIEKIEKELGFNPFKIQEQVTRFIAQHQVDEYLTNFLKASINVLPYLRRLPVKTQFELISSYIGEEERKQGWIRVQETIATRNFTRLFV